MFRTLRYLRKGSCSGRRGIDGPLFLGIDTHALFVPAYASALEVLAANNVEVMIARNSEYTPTPAVSHAILKYNRGRTAGLADGIVITPSHNPPDSGGFKYNPPNGGPANETVTDWIEATANGFLEHKLKGVRRVPMSIVLSAATTQVATDYLFRHRPRWPKDAGVGKTIVSSQMVDRVAAKFGRRLYEVPVGFKWFVDGLLDASLGFAGEESAGATFLWQVGSVWTTDKDSIVPALLAAEITMRIGRDPGEIYRALTRELGEPAERREQAAATPKQRKLLARLSPRQFRSTKLAGERIEHVLARAPGNDAPISGITVITKSAWFAARPSGPDDIYKMYAESLRGENHLKCVVEEAQAMIDGALGVKRLR